MDPDATLAELLELARDVQRDAESWNPADTPDSAAAQMAHAVLELDDWLRRGGATPRAWARLYIGLGGQLDPPAAPTD